VGRIGGQRVDRQPRRLPLDGVSVTPPVISVFGKLCAN
jgi:hypothetical protein